MICYLQRKKTMIVGIIINDSSPFTKVALSFLITSTHDDINSILVAIESHVGNGPLHPLIVTSLISISKYICTYI